MTFIEKTITKRQSYILPNLNIKTVLRWVLLFRPGELKMGKQQSLVSNS